MKSMSFFGPAENPIPVHLLAKVLVLSYSVAIQGRKEHRVFTACVSANSEVELHQQARKDLLELCPDAQHIHTEHVREGDPVSVREI